MCRTFVQRFHLNFVLYPAYSLRNTNQRRGVAQSETKSSAAQAKSAPTSAAHERRRRGWKAERAQIRTCHLAMLSRQKYYDEAH